MDYLNSMKKFPESILKIIKIVEKLLTMVMIFLIISWIYVYYTTSYVIVRFDELATIAVILEVGVLLFPLLDFTQPCNPIPPSAKTNRAKTIETRKFILIIKYLNIWFCKHSQRSS